MAWISSFKAAIYSTNNWSTSIWELTSCLFVWFVESVCSTISRRFTSTTYSCVVSTCWIAFTATVVTSCLSKGSDVHCGIHSIYISEVAWTTLNRSFAIMINIDCCIHIVIISISIYRHTVFMLLMNWVTCTSILSLFAEFGLSNGFRNLCISGVRLARRIHAVKHLVIVLSGVEELLSSHHHLLLMVLATIRSFSLIDQVE